MVAGLKAADLLTLAAGLAVGVGVVVALRKLQGIADDVTGAPGRVLDAVGEAFNVAADYVSDTAAKAYETAIEPRKGTDGWQFFPAEGVAIDPQGNYWKGTRIIWRAPK